MHVALTPLALKSAVVILKSILNPIAKSNQKMDKQLKFSNIPGVTFDLDTEEDGSVRVTVCGSDYDAVLASALNVKNVLPVEQCPEVGALRQDVGNGSWCAFVRTRRTP